MRGIYGALLLLTLMGMTDQAWAFCRVLTDDPIYDDGQLKDEVCNTSGQLKTVTKTGSVTSLEDLLSGEDQTNDLLKVAPQARALGGATPLSYISVGVTEDEHAVCTAACTLYSISATNTNAAVRYLKCENDTAANTAPGTDTPELRFAIPGATTGAGNNPLNITVGLAFSTGLTCWLVTGAADSDVAEVAANELMINYGFKQ